MHCHQWSARRCKQWCTKCFTLIIYFRAIPSLDITDFSSLLVTEHPVLWHLPDRLPWLRTELQTANMSEPGDSPKRPSLKQIQQKNLVQKRMQLFQPNLENESDTRRKEDVHAKPVIPQTEYKHDTVPSKDRPSIPKHKPLQPKLDTKQPRPADKSPSSPEASTSVVERAKLFGGGPKTVAGSGAAKPATVPKVKPLGTSADTGGELRTTPADVQLQLLLKKRLPIANCPDLVAGDGCSKINKQRNQQRLPSNPSTAEYDGVISLAELGSDPASQDAGTPTRMSPKSETKPVPPKKPPRTFAHDEYLEVKARKKELKQQVMTSKGSSYEDIEPPANPDYEEVNVKIHGNRTQDGLIYEDVDIKGQNKSSQERAHGDTHLYEEVAPVQTQKPAIQPLSPIPKADGQKVHLPYTRSPNSKLPPLPKLPLPGAAAADSGSPFDSPVVRVTKHSNHLNKDSFSGKKTISNPAYNRAHEVLEIETFGGGTGGLKRSCSDEYLYVDPPWRAVKGFDSPPNVNSIYQDPVDAVRIPGTSTVTEHGVVLDSDGYAQPVMEHPKLSRMVSISYTSRNTRILNATSHVHAPFTERKTVTGTLPLNSTDQTVHNQ